LTAALRREERAVLLAVSGGPDSLALLDACAQLAPLPGTPWRFEVCWVDHGVREASSAEGAWVEALATERGLSFHPQRVSLKEGPGFEARAREAREAALEQVRMANGLDVVATGHTASDQAETVLMRLSRGAALRGAGGILVRRGRVIRPLLGVTRQEVLAHLHSRGLAAIDDPMNADLTFLRCRVRHRMLPVLEELTDVGVARRLARFAALAAEDDAYLQERAEAALRRLALDAGEADRVGLLALEPPIRRRALHHFIAEVAGPLDGERLDAAVHALSTGKRCELREGWTLCCEGARVRLRPPAQETVADEAEKTRSAAANGRGHTALSHAPK
jgi:tRNA(Ile)-lysidine synthase